VVKNYNWETVPYLVKILIMNFWLKLTFLLLILYIKCLYDNSFLFVSVSLSYKQYIELTEEMLVLTKNL